MHICFGYAAIICFGYAAIIHERPSGYSFLPELCGCWVRQVSIETAQSRLDTGVLEGLRGKTVILGVLDLSDMEVETPETVAARIRRALPHVDADKVVVAPDCGMKYLPRGRLRQDAGHGRGRRHRAPGARGLNAAPAGQRAAGCSSSAKPGM